MGTKLSQKQPIFITGVAGFIGFHLAESLLKSGEVVVGVDNLSPYYDVRLKQKRLAILKKYPQFSFHKLSIGKYKPLLDLIKKTKPREVVHLAAQAGVRYSVSHPLVYAEANYVGTMNVFECARVLGMSRVIYASTSSVYGGNTKMPFSEDDRVDSPLSVYAATKRANELLAESYARLYKMEMIGLRFFTVYGTWSRPDLALFKFAQAILEGKTIELYNRGEARRSFTHVSDIVAVITELLRRPAGSGSSLYNVGGSRSVALSELVLLLERELGITAKKTLVPLPQGDVPETEADTRKLERELGITPQVTFEEIVKEFVPWFRENQKFLRSLKKPLQ